MDFSSSPFLVSLVAALVMFIGLVGTILPGVPGLPLIWIAAVVFGFLTGWGAAAVAAMIAITVVVLAAVAFSVMFPASKAAVHGANSLSIMIGLATALVGFFVIPVVGVFLGAFGLYFAELVQGRDSIAAAKATKQTLLGMGVSLLVEFFAGLLCCLIWLVWAVVWINKVL